MSSFHFETLLSPEDLLVFTRLLSGVAENPSEINGLLSMADFLLSRQVTYLYTTADVL